MYIYLTGSIDLGHFDPETHFKFYEIKRKVSASV